MRRSIFASLVVLFAAACGRTEVPPASAPTTDAGASPGIRAPRAPRGQAGLPVPRPPADTAPAAPRLEDLVRADDTFDSLKARYGAAIARETLPGGEGDDVAGWVLYPADPARRIEIYPDDAGLHPASLTVRDASTWTRADGVHVGMSSAELAALNGRPFVFSGFGWDYGGAVGDWKGGALAHGGRFVGPVMLCEPDPEPAGYPSGDGDFSSDLPVLKAHPAKVCEFGVDVAPPAP